MNLRFQGHSANILSKTEFALGKVHYPTMSRYLEENQSRCGSSGWVNQSPSSRLSGTWPGGGKMIGVLGMAVCEMRDCDGR